MDLTPEDLARLAEAAGELRGWDIARLRMVHDPLPWEFADVVRRYVGRGDRVLDLGTGGGEQFARLAGAFAWGLGVDRVPAMIAAARARPGVRFAVMDAHRLGVAGAVFDAVLARYAPFAVGEVARVLRPGGVFVAQAIGGRNARNVSAVFGWRGRRGRTPHTPWRPQVGTLRFARAFRDAGCEVLEATSYDVPVYWPDVASLVLWLRMMPLPEAFDPVRHAAAVSELVRRHTTPRGIATNDHRELLVVRKG